ncbi:MAG: hypothetical protein ACOCWB_00700 [Bacteroidota bacterium]
MKKSLVILSILSVFTTQTHSQTSGFQKIDDGKDSLKHVYFTTSTDIIFQYIPHYSDEHEYTMAMRTSILFNTSFSTHIDFSKHFGLLQGFAIKNVGMKTKNEILDNIRYDYIIRRSYMAETYAAMKIGALQKFSFLYIGAGYDFSFHYRQKQKINNKKIIDSQWLSKATEIFIPSAIIGYQFPKGFHLQLQYYMSNFLNASYKGKFGDFSRFPDTQILQFSISFQQKEGQKNTNNPLKKYDTDKFIHL